MPWALNPRSGRILRRTLWLRHVPPFVLMFPTRSIANSLVECPLSEIHNFSNRSHWTDQLECLGFEGTQATLLKDYHSSCCNNPIFPLFQPAARCHFASCSSGNSCCKQTRESSQVQFTRVEMSRGSFVCLSLRASNLSNQYLQGVRKIVSKRTFALYKSNNNNVSQTSLAQRNFINRNHSSPKKNSYVWS
jgi:hypothetical protein